MNRPLLVAIIGVLVVIAAIVLNFTLEDQGGITPEVNSTVMSDDGSTEAVPGAASELDRVFGPSFDVVRIDPQGNTVMAGRAGPAATVIILDGETEIGRITADG